MNNYPGMNVVNGVVAGIVYAVLGYIRNSQKGEDFDAYKFTLTIIWGFMIGLTAQLLGLPLSEAESLLLQIGALYILQKVWNIVWTWKKIQDLRKLFSERMMSFINEDSLYSLKIIGLIVLYNLMVYFFMSFFTELYERHVIGFYDLIMILVMFYVILVFILVFMFRIGEPVKKSVSYFLKKLRV